MSATKTDLLLFFDRPSEPCFMQKGNNRTVLLIPENFFPDKYRSLYNSLASRFGTGATRTVPVRNIALPDLSVPMQLGCQRRFSLWIPKHKEMASKLIAVFMSMRDVDDLLSVCSYCQLRINPYLFIYSLSVALLHRPDTRDMDLPSLAETFPEKFMDPKVFRRAREVSTVVPTGSRLPILIPINNTSATNEPEQRVAYFREDLGVNLHHVHWHMVYPFDSSEGTIVNKDRRGELFYYMHQQIVARYSAARLCNDLDRVQPYSDFRRPIAEGYFPKLTSLIASRTWPPRFENTILKDLDRPVEDIKFEVIDLEICRDRMNQIVDEMAVMMPDGRKEPLEEPNGIDILGNTMESSELSPNGYFYGALHNLGHLFISFAHDPKNKHSEDIGVMGDPATAMRDPVFYRWHSHLDDIFQLYKKKLPPYSDRLDYPGIHASSISVESSGVPNVLNTFWEQSTVDLNQGLDFTPRGSLLATFTHLQHDEFTYVIEVNNISGQGVVGTVRIFMAPVFNENGQQFPFEEQRRMMIELDKFTQPLNTGNNTIRRRSVDSSVTIPHERTFRDQNKRPGEPGSAEAAHYDFCGCGWPHHMLIPKGNDKGYPVVLFAMITNWNEDRVQQDLAGSCDDAASYCGVRDRKYPDRRSMGYPFDRPATPNVTSLTDFLRPNMAIRQCTIKFSNVTRQRSQRHPRHTRVV